MKKTVFQYNTEMYNSDDKNNYILSKPHVNRLKEAKNFIKNEVERLRENGQEEIKLLSIGCATGVFEEQIIKEFGIEVHGLDGAETSLKAAREKGVITVNGDFEEEFPFPDESFDIVFAGEVLEHLMDVKSFLVRVNKVLKKDGVFILTTPNLARFTDRIKFLFGVSPRHVAPFHQYLFLHIHPLTWGTLRQGLRDTGFYDLKLTSHALEILTGAQYASRVLGKLFPTLGVTLIVSARKG